MSACPVGRPEKVWTWGFHAAPSLAVLLCGCAALPPPEPAITALDTRICWSPKRRYYVEVAAPTTVGTPTELPVKVLGNRGQLNWTVPAPTVPDEELIPADDGRRLVRLCPYVTEPEATALEIYEDGLLLAEYRLADLVTDLGSLQPTSLASPEPGKPPVKTWLVAGGRPETLLVQESRYLDVPTVEGRLIRFDMSTGRAERGLPPPRSDARAEETRKALSAVVAAPAVREVLRGVPGRALTADLLGNLYAVDSAKGALLRASIPESQPDTPTPLPTEGPTTVLVEGLTGGAAAMAFAPDRAGRPGRGLTLALLADRRVVQLEPSGRLRVLAERFRGRPLLGPTDVVYDNRGNLFFSDGDASAPTARTGAIYLVAADGLLLQAARDLASPAGLAISGDATELYLAESGADRLLAFPIVRGATRTGEQPPSLGRPRILAKLARGRRPGSLVRDINGNLYVACAGGRVEVFGPRGDFLASIPVGTTETPDRLLFGTGKADARALFVSVPDRAGPRVLRLEVGLVGQVGFAAAKEPLAPITRLIPAEGR